MTRNVYEKEYISSEETLNFCRARHGRMAPYEKEQKRPDGSPFKVGAFIAHDSRPRLAASITFRLMPSTGQSARPITRHVADMPKSTRMTHSGRPHHVALVLGSILSMPRTAIGYGREGRD
jgi:hypothetical protein